MSCMLNMHAACHSHTQHTVAGRSISRCICPAGAYLVLNSLLVKQCVDMRNPTSKIMAAEQLKVMFGGM
jgi:hypothetical protein